MTMAGERRRWRRGLPALAAGALALCAACGRNAARLDRDEDRNPLVQRALEYKHAQRYDEAIRLLTEALEKNPRLASAHLALGQLFDTQKEDYLRALYHYQRYLELRPQTEKKLMINDLIRQARLSFAATLPKPPPGAVERIALLQREVDGLRQQAAQLLQDNADLQQRLAASTSAVPRLASVPALPVTNPPPGFVPAPARTAAPPVAVIAPPPPRPLPAPPAARTYVVQPRDTLTSIALKLYHDRSRWKKIYAANRDTLATPQSIRVGQTLVIP